MKNPDALNSQWCKIYADKCSRKSSGTCEIWCLRQAEHCVAIHNCCDGDIERQRKCINDSEYMHNRMKEMRENDLNYKLIRIIEDNTRKYKNSSMVKIINTIGDIREQNFSINPCAVKKLHEWLSNNAKIDAKGSARITEKRGHSPYSRADHIDDALTAGIIKGLMKEGKCFFRMEMKDADKHILDLFRRVGGEDNGMTRIRASAPEVFDEYLAIGRNWMKIAKQHYKGPPIELLPPNFKILRFVLIEERVPCSEDSILRLKEFLEKMKDEL